MSDVTSVVNAYARGEMPWHELVAFMSTWSWVKPRPMTLLDDDFDVPDGSIRELDTAWTRAGLPREDRRELSRLMQQHRGRSGAVAKRATIMWYTW